MYGLEIFSLFSRFLRDAISLFAWKILDFSLSLPSRHDGFQIIGDMSTLRVLSQVKHMLNQSYIYSRLKIPLYIPGSIKTHRIYTRDFIYPARITMKLYDMIQVYSSGSTVIMHMHFIWPVLHMTSCLVAINKNRDMCFDMKNGKKTYFSGEIPVNDCQNVWRGLKSIRLIKKKKFTYLKSFMQRIIQKPILKSVFTNVFFFFFIFLSLSLSPWKL